MSEVMETLEWPRRLETMTMFWPVCSMTDDGCVEVAQAVDCHFGIAHSACPRLDRLAELFGDDPLSGRSGKTHLRSS